MLIAVLPKRAFFNNGGRIYGLYIRAPPNLLFYTQIQPPTCDFAQRCVLIKDLDSGVRKQKFRITAPLLLAR